MKLRLANFVLLPILLCLVSVVAGQEPTKESPYYPLKVGNKWTYRFTSGSSGTVDVRVTKLEKVGDVMCALLEAKAGSDGTPTTEHVAVQADGVYRYTSEGHKIEPPLRFLKLPPKSGDRWEVDSKSAGETVKGTLTLGEAEVTVGKMTNRKFKAITADTKDMTVGGNKMEQTWWFAPEVGMVKQVYKFADKEVVLELESFEPGK
jgi:hypothetical protein